jgi:eukaryotic-like serine/threonine-protein kinase
MTDTNTTFSAPKRRKTGKPALWMRLLWNLLLVAAGFVVAGVLFLVVMDNIVMPWYQRSGQEIELPAMTGLTPEDALKVADDRFLVVEDQREFTETYPIGVISFQLPAAGTAIKPGRRVHVKISKGARPITVPDVVGKPPPNARLDIKAAGLTVVEGGFIPSNEYPFSMVARQHPEAGVEVGENSPVAIYISDGRPETDTVMPDLLNLSYSTAVDSLRASGFNIRRLKVQPEVRDDLLPDTVIDQYPDPGVPANTAAEVRLVVSEAPAEEPVMEDDQ